MIPQAPPASNIPKHGCHNTMACLRSTTVADYMYHTIPRSDATIGSLITIKYLIIGQKSFLHYLLGYRCILPCAYPGREIEHTIVQAFRLEAVFRSTYSLLHIFSSRTPKGCLSVKKR